MTANFFIIKAPMMGVDYHTYFMDAEGVPVPIPDAPHAVATLLWIGPKTKFTSTVTATGSSMVQEGSDAMSAHVPFPGLPPGHPFEIAQILFLNVASSSKVRVVKASVHGNGKALACCMSEFVGWDSNCSDLPFPTNVVLSFTTVITDVGLLEMLFAIWGHIIDLLVREFLRLFDGMLGKLLKGLGRGLDDIARSILKKLFEEVSQIKKIIRELAKPRRTAILSAIEGASPALEGDSAP